MSTETYTSRVMYSPDGKTKRVDTPQIETVLTQQGWAFTPFPEPPEPEKRLDLQAQVDELRDLLMRHDAVLMAGKRK